MCCLFLPSTARLLLLCLALTMNWSVLLGSLRLLRLHLPAHGDVQ